MHFVRQYSVSYYNDRSLPTLLKEKYAIDSEILNMLGEPIIFDVPENHPMMSALESILPCESPSEVFSKECILARINNHPDAITPVVSIIYTPIYSEEERRCAPWLGVRSIAGKVKTPDGFRCKKQCILPDRPDWRNAVHRIYDDSFQIGPPVKWGRNAIAASEWCDTMLFCSESTKKILSAENLRGLQFDSVHSKKRPDPMPDVFHLSSFYEIPDDSFVGLSYCRNHTCPVCGMKMLMPTDGRMQYGIRKGRLDSQVDVYNSPPLFLGRFEDGEPVDGLSRLIISQRFYRALVDKQLDRALVFTPLQEV